MTRNLPTGRPLEIGEGRKHESALGQVIAGQLPVLHLRGINRSACRAALRAIEGGQAPHLPGSEAIGERVGKVLADAGKPETKKFPRIQYANVGQQGLAGIGAKHEPIGGIRYSVEENSTSSLTVISFLQADSQTPGDHLRFNLGDGEFHVVAPNRGDVVLYRRNLAMTLGDWRTHSTRPPSGEHVSLWQTFSNPQTL